MAPSDNDVHLSIHIDRGPAGPKGRAVSAEVRLPTGQAKLSCRLVWAQESGHGRSFLSGKEGGGRKKENLVPTLAKEKEAPAGKRHRAKKVDAQPGPIKDHAMQRQGRILGAHNTLKRREEPPRGQEERGAEVIERALDGCVEEVVRLGRGSYAAHLRGLIFKMDVCKN